LDNLTILAVLAPTREQKRCGVSANHFAVFGLERRNEHDLFLGTRCGIPRNPDAIGGTQIALREMSGKLLFGESESLIGLIHSLGSQCRSRMVRVRVIKSINHQLAIDWNRL